MKLTVDGGRARQRLLVAELAEHGLDGAVLGQREYVYYFSGHLCNPQHAAALLVKADGTVVLAADEGADRDGLAVDDLVGYVPAYHCTMHCRQLEAAASALAPAITGARHGADLAGVSVLALTRGELPVHLGPDLLRLRKSKHADEVAVLRDCIRITEVMYDAARAIIRPGIDEVTLFSEVQAAATREAGEFLEVFGNDFCANAFGGKARRRASTAGLAAGWPPSTGSSRTCPTNWTCG